jgi:hypothetical protein
MKRRTQNDDEVFRREFWQFDGNFGSMKNMQER